MVPMRMQIVPLMTGHLRRPVQVTAKPTRVPVKEDATVGMMRRRPDEVALVRRTAWKYRGLGVVSREGDVYRGFLHVEQDRVGKKRCDDVGEDEVCSGGVADKVERHDGLVNP